MTFPHDADRPVGFRRLTRDDFPRLGSWLAMPHVEPWWQEPWGPDDIEARYGPSVDATGPAETRVVTLGGQPVGLAIRYRIADTREWLETLAPTGAPVDGFGIDYLIGDPECIGRGVGPRMIASFVADSWDRYPMCPACVVAVHEHNRRSWRALERAGFTRVWSGALVSEDQSDAGPQVVYVLRRPSD